MQTILVIDVRVAFNRARAYPMNEQATLLAQLVGSKTLTLATLAQAERMGFTVEIVTATGCHRVTHRELSAMGLD